MAYWLRMPVADVTSRGLTWIGLMALISATIAAGRRMAIQLGREPLAGLLALALVFLTPSLQTLYANNRDTSLRHPLIVIPPRWEVIGTNVWEGAYGLAAGTGFSVVCACITAFTVVALLTEEGAANGAVRRSCAVMAMAALAIDLNSISGLCCWGVGAGYCLVHAWRRWPTHVFLLTFAAGFLVWFHFSGFGFSSGRYMTMKVAEDVTTTYGRIYQIVRDVSLLAAGGAFLLLGLRSLAILSLAWGRKEIKVVLLLFAAVYSGVFVTMTLQNKPVTYLGMVLSVFAAGPVAELLGQLGTGTARALQLWNDLQRTFRKYCAAVWVAEAVALVPTLVTIVRRRSVHELPGFSKVLIAGFLLASIAYVLFRVLELSSWRPSRGQVLVFAGGVAAVCFLGTLKGVVAAAADWGESTIILDAGRTKSLLFAHDRLPANAVLATSRHEVPTRELRERSLMYSAISGRHLLLEGWIYFTVQGSPELPQVRKDNDELFATHDPREAWRIAQRYGITHIFLEPGQSLGFDFADARWLKRLDCPGSMGLLAVDLDYRKY